MSEVNQAGQGVTLDSGYPGVLHTESREPDVVAEQAAGEVSEIVAIKIEAAEVGEVIEVAGPEAGEARLFQNEMAHPLQVCRFNCIAIRYNTRLRVARRSKDVLLYYIGAVADVDSSCLGVPGGALQQEGQQERGEGNHDEG